MLFGGVVPEKSTDLPSGFGQLLEFRGYEDTFISKVMLRLL